MPFLFEKLDVYQKSLNLAAAINTLIYSFPNGNRHIVDQLGRAALSVSCNIAEGNGRFHKRDRINFFCIARGSAFECVPLLELARRKGLIGSESHETLKIQIESISRMLSGLMIGAENRKN